MKWSHCDPSHVLPQLTPDERSLDADETRRWVKLAKEYRLQVSHDQVSHDSCAPCMRVGATRADARDRSESQPPRDEPASAAEIQAKPEAYCQDGRLKSSVTGWFTIPQTRAISAAPDRRGYHGHVYSWYSPKEGKDLAESITRASGLRGAIVRDFRALWNLTKMTPVQARAYKKQNDKRVSAREAAREESECQPKTSEIEELLLAAGCSTDRTCPHSLHTAGDIRWQRKAPKDPSGPRGVGQRMLLPCRPRNRRRGITWRNMR